MRPAAECRVCGTEPLLDLPIGIRRKVAAWQFWELHRNAHAFADAVLRAFEELLFRGGRKA